MSGESVPVIGPLEVEVETRDEEGYVSREWMRAFGVSAVIEFTDPSGKPLGEQRGLFITKEDDHKAGVNSNSLLVLTEGGTDNPSPLFDLQKDGKYKPRHGTLVRDVILIVGEHE